MRPSKNGSALRPNLISMPGDEIDVVTEDIAGPIIEASVRPVMDNKEAKRVAAVFMAVHTSASVRLARGAAERKRIFDALGKPGKVESYRLDWLKEASKQLAGHMATVAHDFNLQHSGFDQCSVQDLVDVLEMVIEKYKAK